MTNVVYVRRYIKVHQCLNLGLTLSSRVYFSSAAGFPVAGVGSRRLRRTPALHASLSCGSTLARFHLTMSLFTHAAQVLRWPPLFLPPGIGMFLMVLMQEEARDTCPYHLSRRVRSADSISSIPSLAQRVAEDTSLSGLTPHIHRIMLLSFRRNLSISS